MAQNVKLPNGQIVSFPDDATPAEIDGALNTYYPQFAPKEHPYDALQRVVDTAISNTIPTETLPEVPRQPEAEAEAAAREDRIRQRREAEGIDKLGTFGRYTHSFASGVGLATGTGINYIGRRFGIQSLEEFGNQIQDVAAARTPADQTFGEQVVSGIGSVASALATAAPISIAAESAPVLAGIAGIATFAPRIAKGLQIVSQWSPSAFAGAFEAAGNATQTYDDVLKKTGNKDLALHQADKTFLLNLPVNAALDKIGIFNKEGGVASRIIRAKLAEGTQEGVQQAISNYFAGNPVGEQFTQNAVVGGVVGGLAKAGHIAVERLAGKDDDDSATPPPDINNATNVDEAIAAANASLQTTVGDELTPAIDAFKADWEARMRDAAPPPMIGMEEPAHQSIVMPERAAPQDIFAPDRPLSKPLLELAELLRGMNVEEQTRGLMRLDPLMRRDVSNVMRALDDTEPAGLIVPGAGIQPGQGEASRITNESTLAASSVQPAAAMPAATTGVPALTERAAREIISKTPGMEMRPHRDVANRFEVVPAVSTAGEARGVFSTQPVPVAQQQLADQEAPAVAAAPAPTVVSTVAPALTLEQQQSNQAALDAERSSQPRRMFGEHSRLRSESGPDIKGERVTRPMRKFLAQLGRLTGTKIVFEYAPNESDGVVPVHGENTIHINTAATINPLSVMGHEVTHVLKDKHREAWQAIRTALSDTLGTGEERRAALMRFADDYWFAHPDRLEAISRREDFSTPLTDEEKRAFGTSENTIEDFLLDELTSDLGGAHWSSEQFWTDTFAKIEKQHGDKARGIIERLVSAIKESLNKFMMLVRQHQQAPYTTVSAEQIEKTRDAVTSAYAKFINEERRNEPEHVEDVGVHDTEAEHAYHSNPTGEQQGVELDAARRAELGEIEPAESRNRDAETRMFFEVAPNPNNLPLKRAWDRLSDKQQRSISEEIKQRVIPGLLKSLGIRATIQGQLGGWMNDTNPSFALVVKGGDIAMAARAITHVLDQESVYTLGLKPFTGAQKSGIIRIEVGDRSRAQIHQLYMAVRRIEPKIILGHSTINGEMLIGLPIETMQEIKSKVIDTLQKFNVEGVDFIQGYSSNVTESDYESWLYGSPGEHSEARDIDRWQADARRLFAGRSDGTGRPGLGGLAAEEDRRSERRDGTVSAVGIHYSQAKRDYLASSAFGTGLKGAENERIAQSGDPRLKHRIYFYVNPGRAIRPEVGVGAHAHRAELTGLYDASADPRDLTLGRDANEFESALLDAGYNGYIAHERGVAVMLGPRSMRVDYMGLNNNPDVPVAERAVPSAYKAKQSAIMSNRILPSGQLTGAEWKAIVPAVVPSVDVSHLDDSRMYYRDQIVKRPVESQPRASEPRPVPQWYRSALADEAAAVTAKSMPVSGWQGWIKGLRANGKVKPDEITWSGIEDFIAAHGDERITADAVRAYLSEFGVKVQTLLRGESNPRTYDTDVQVEEDEDEREDLEPDFHWGRQETEEPDHEYMYDRARERYDEVVEQKIDDEWDATADEMRGYISHWSSFEEEAREQLGTLFNPSRDQVIAAAEALAIKDAAQESFEYYKTDDDPDDISEQELVERAIRILSDDDLVEQEARRRVEAEINEDKLMDELVDQEREWYYQDSDSPFTQAITVTVGDDEYEFTYRDWWGEKQVWDDSHRREVDLGERSYRLDEAGIQNAIWMHLIEEIGIDTRGAAVQRDTSGFIPTKWDSFATERHNAVAGSYREMQLLLPQGAVGDLTSRKREGVTYTVYDKDGNAQIETALGEEHAKERAEEIGGRYEKNNYPVPITERNDVPDFYYTTHFPEANILGFFRFDERIDQDGKRVMFVQEIQSDWGSFWYKAQKAEKNLPAMRERLKAIQEQLAPVDAEIAKHRKVLKDAYPTAGAYTIGRMEGGKVPDAASPQVVAAIDAIQTALASIERESAMQRKLERDIADAEHDIGRKPVIGPFTDATPKWTALVVKRIIAHAVEYGFDRVAWTTGAQQVERWKNGLRQQIDRIEWDKTEKGVHIVALKDGEVRQSTRYAETELTDAIGKLMSDRIFNDPNQSGVIEGKDITIDDIGMAASYDRIIPNTVNDLLRRLDKEVKVREIQVGKVRQYSVAPDPDADGRWIVQQDGKELVSHPTKERAEANVDELITARAATELGTQLGFDITDKLRDTAERGMPLFSERRRRQDERSMRKADDRRAWYYSQLGAAINAIPGKLRTGSEIALWLQSNAGKLQIKKDELQWSGVLDWLQGQGRTAVTKEQVQDWLRNNGVQVREVVLGASRQLSAAMRDLMPDTDTFNSADWVAVSERFEGIAKQWERNGDKRQANKYWELSYEATRISEGLDANGSSIGAARYEMQTLPGGKDYRELLLTLPGETHDQRLARWKKKYPEWREGKSYKSVMSVDDQRTFEQELDGTENDFRSSHFTDQPNILAHVRFNSRLDADGRRVLFIEELQSDWGQKGRKEGFADPNSPVYAVFAKPGAFLKSFERKHEADKFAESVDGIVREEKREPGDDSRPPSAPFVTDTKAWTGLALKRMVAYAVDNGFDAIAWTTGEQQAERYDLSKQVESINYDPVDEWLTAYPKNSSRDNISQSAKLSELPDIIGKEAAKKIEQAIESAEYDRRQWSIEEDEGKFVVIDPNGELRYTFGGDLETFDTYADAEEWIDANYNDGQTGVTISGLDLKVGGEGMVAFYDEIVPQIARKLGATMQTVRIATRETLSVNERYTYSTLTKLSAKKGEQHFVVKEGTNEQVAGPFKTWNEAHDWLLAHDPALATKQPGFEITDAMRKQVRVTGMPLFSTQRRADNVTDLITRPVRAFHKSLRANMQDRAEEIQRKVDEYDGWKWDAGDRVKSLKTGGVYLITGRTWNDRHGAMYRYETADKDNAGDWQSGTLVADKAHETMERMGGPARLSAKRDLTEGKLDTRRKEITILSGTRMFHGAHDRPASEIAKSGTLLTRPTIKSGGGLLSEGGMIWFGWKELAQGHAKGEVDILASSGRKDNGNGQVFEAVTDRDYRLANQNTYKVNEEEAIKLTEALGYDGKWNKVKAGQELWRIVSRAFENAPNLERYKTERGEMRVIWPIVLKTLGFDGMYDGSGVAIMADNGIRLGSPMERFSEQRRALDAWAGDTVVRNSDGSLRVMYHGTARDISTFRPKQADAIFLTDYPEFADAFASMSHGWLMRNLDKWMTPDQIAAAQVAARSAAKVDLKTGLKLDNALRDIENLAATNPYLNKAVEPYLPSGANIMPLYVRAENPFDYRDPAQIAALEREVGATWPGKEFYNGESVETTHRIGDVERGDWGAIESAPVQAYIRKHHDSFYVREQGKTNLAVFSPNQVKSASGNQGTYSREDNDIRRSERRFQPSGHGQYLTELKNVARDLDSNDRRTKQYAQSRLVKVMDMPAVLRQIVDGTRGKVFRNVPQRIVGSGTTLLVKPMNQHVNSKHDGVVNPKVIFDLPKYLADPLAIFSGEGGTNPDSFRIVLRDRFDGKNPVVAIEPQAGHGFVLTIHPSDDKQLQRWIDGGLLHYVDEKAAGLRPAATDGSVGGSIPRIPNVDWSVAKERAESKGRVVVTRDQVADMDEARLSAPRGAIAGQPINQSWQAPEMTDWDNFVRKMQDKQVDTKRVLQAIRDAGNTIAEKFDTYLQETLYHGRTATRVHNFVDGELRQLLEDMHRRNIGMQELDDYLWARHAVERNAQIAKVNPSMPDGGSGLTNAQAADILSGQQVTVGTRDIKLDTAKMRGYAAIATKVDAITNGTLDLLVKYGLEKQQTVDQWRRTYQHYAPLMRDMEADSGFLGAFNLGLGTGQGFNVRGSASKRAMGSQRSVTDVLANVAMQRERAIVRGEKNRIAQALYGLAISAPNTDFWIPVNPDLNQRLNPASLQKLIGELTHIGVNPIDAMNIAKEPKQRYIDNNTGMVAERINPSLRGRDDVLSTRINGEERFVMFSTDQRAQMMVRSLKNLDADQLGGFTQAVAPVTRWFASINTQFNPIFGLTNGIRDIGTGMLNLSSTPLSGHRADILRNTFSALKGVYLDLRDHRAGRQPTSKWAQLYEQFALDGGQTGYRDMFATSEERANEIAKELKAAGKGQSWFAVGEKHSKVFGWLSDYNTAVENAVRLSAYKVALDNGRSRQDAARIAKELTVNFNRKGLAATQTGALYAFFNAAVQGTARIAETMIKDGKLTPAGQRIMYGGMLLGVMQAVAGAFAGWDDNEPPQFVREKNLIIPIFGTDKYVSIPMPLGFHVLPNIGRISAEFALSGFRNPSKRLISLANVILDGFNPIGSGTLAQTLSPTIADPIVALSENKDWTGKSIYKEDFNKMHPTPGWTRTKDTASDLSKWLAYGINYLTGGGKYEIGAVSPTPDQIDYLISQATGGVGREGLKVWQAGKAEATGEDVPMYKVPVVGRFVGETKGQASEIAKFYDNLKRIGEHKSAIDEMKQAHDSAALQAYYADHPDARFVQLADRAQREIGYLRRQKSDMIEKGVSRERIKLMEDRITAKVQGFNQMLAEKRE